MPLYDYQCPRCGWKTEQFVPILDRDVLRCARCNAHLERYLPRAPLTRVAGVPTKGGGPDKFTADMLGIPLAELPAGLKTPEPRE